jgi:hypothetical protein
MSNRMREEMQAEEDAILTGRIHNWHDNTPEGERELERPMRHVHEATAEALARLWEHPAATAAQGELWCRTCKGTGLIPVGGNPDSRDPQCQPDMDDCPVCSR